MQFTQPLQLALSYVILSDIRPFSVTFQNQALVSLAHHLNHPDVTKFMIKHHYYHYYHLNITTITFSVWPKLRVR